MEHAKFYTDTPDAALLLMFKQKHEDAFTLLYKKYQQPLLNFSSRFLDDKTVCEDICQDLFMQFYANGISLAIRSSLSSYLYTSLKNKILNHLRKQAIYKKHLLIYDDRSHKSVNDLEKYFDSPDLEKTVIRLINRLPEKYRDIYFLRYKHELSIRKVSGLLNRSVNTLEKQSRKLTSFLRENLKVSVN